MAVLEQFEAFYTEASAETQAKLDALMRILMQADDIFSLEEKLRLAERAADTSPDYATDAEVQAVRARFFRQAS